MGLLLRRGWRIPVLLGLAVALLLLEAASASATFRPGPPPSRATTRGNTDMVMSGVGPGQAVTGYIANPDNPFDPVAEGYPASNPTTGWTPKDEGFAGIIYGTPTGGPANSLRLYCIDINTSTWGGIGYTFGTWDAAGVPNVGYVAQLLNSYYPNTNEPAALTNLNQKAAAVQAAIWFFSDRYVLSTSDALRPYVVDIVNAVIAKGQLVQPPPPSLTITPGSLSSPRRVVGPFTVSTDHPPATVTVTNGTMYSNRAGTNVLGDGTTATVPDGQQIWLRSAGGASTAVLQAVSTATVPSGNVYLYDGNTAGVNDAQRLILAENATLKTTVQASATFVPFGSLIVKKTIAGPAAGTQGKVVIRVVCDDGVKRRPFVIPAGTGKGTKSRIYRHIPAKATCTVIETSSGGTTTTSVVVIGGGQEATISEGKRATVKIKDIYRFVPGSLLVRKTIAGPAAGKQGEVTIHTTCNGQALKPDFVIPAGTPVGDYTKQYDGIRVPAKCTVTETVDGHTSVVSVVVEGSGQTVSVPAGDIVEADISDTYGLLPGQLEVTKTIAGAQAGQQGQVVIHTVCTPAPAAGTPDFVIPAGAPAGVHSQIYSGIPAGAKCVVTETTDGHTSTVSVVVAGSPHTTTVPAGGAGAATITDTYGAVPGSLLVTKNISGPRAGHQGAVTIHVACTGVAPSDFVIPAGTPASSVSHSFDGLPAGSVCTVTETTDGSTASVIATVSGDGQNVTIPAGKVASVSLMDVYDEGSVSADATASLTVIKHITGPAARQHGRIAILVACGGPIFNFSFVIPAHAGAGSVTRHFNNIPAGSRCTVTEVAVGRTGKVGVVAIGRRQHVTIPATGSATVRLTDTFRRIVVVPTPRVTG